MKYLSFDEWFVTGMLILKDFEDTIGGMKTIMEAAWDAAIENYPENGQNEVIGKKITELFNAINDAEKIDYDYHKQGISKGAMGIMQAEENLVKYLRKLRKELK